MRLVGTDPNKPFERNYPSTGEPLPHSHPHTHELPEHNHPHDHPHTHDLPEHEHPHEHEQIGVPTYLTAPVVGQVGVYYETDDNGDLTIWIEDGK